MEFPFLTVVSKREVADIVWERRLCQFWLHTIIFIFLAKISKFLMKVGISVFEFAIFVSTHIWYEIGDIQS